jgi:hypothetical protein
MAPFNPPCTYDNTKKKLIFHRYEIDKILNNKFIKKIDFGGDA